MAGRAAAPLPRSARSQPPALRAPLFLLLSPALGGGGSSLLGSPAPVIRGAGLGGRSPRPPAAPRVVSASASPEPGRPPAPRAQGLGRGSGPSGPRPDSPSEKPGAPATRRLGACGRTQTCVIRVPRTRHARAKEALCLPAGSVTWGQCFLPLSDSVYPWTLGIKPRLRAFGGPRSYSPPQSSELHALPTPLVLLACLLGSLR